MERIIERVAFSDATPRRKRVAAYARVSSGKDAMLHSLSAQVSYFSRQIQSRKNWEYAGVYTDEAKSGTKDSREGFQQLLADCRLRKVDMVITKSVSRFARNTVTLLETVRELNLLGVDIFFEEQNIHTRSSDGELLLTILASYAEEEARSVSENQKWRVRKNFEEGMPWNGTILGYRIEDGQYVIVPEQAEIVMRIYKMYLDGSGFQAIANTLNQEGIPTRAGKNWIKESVAHILRNYSYTGNLLLQQTYQENYRTKRKVINLGEFPKYHATETHEAIIPMETFEAVQAEIYRRAEKHTHPGVKKQSYPFTGLIVCDNCGKHFRRRVTATGAVWICPTYNSRGKAACPSKQIPEITLLEITSDVVLGDLTAVRAKNGNELVFCFKDGTQTVKRWQDRSRADSWTAEMKATARCKAQKGRQGESNHG